MVFVEYSFPDCADMKPDRMVHDTASVPQTSCRSGFSAHSCMIHILFEITVRQTLKQVIGGDLPCPIQMREHVR